MKIRVEYHRGAGSIVNEPNLKQDYEEILSALDDILEDELLDYFLKQKQEEKSAGKKNYRKSISDALNFFIRENLENQGWQKEPKIFKNPDYEAGAWRLDFAKNDICVEVAFNHREAVPHNMLKAVLSTEGNDMLEKEYISQIGVIITATKELKKTGNFDSAAGTFDDYVELLKPYSFFIRCPMIIIGLEGLETFYIDKNTKLPVKSTSR
mgnify:FL=1|tara:strand:- start:125 stop:754 length:630 start_codon:yes stop_codon:yes gene_type:complete